MKRIVLAALMCLARVAAGQELTPPQAGTVSKAKDSGTVRIAVDGRLDLRYVYRDGSLEEAAANLNGSSGHLPGFRYVSADALIRLDAQLSEKIRAVFSVQHVPYDQGGVHILAGGGSGLTIDQAWVEAAGDVTLRVGQFESAYRLRPQADPFFFDSDAESMFSGASASFVRATADRDVSASAGVRAQFALGVATLAEVLLVTRGEGAPTSASDDETVALLYLNSLTGERGAAFILAGLAAGPGQESEIWTVAGGVDQYFGRGRELEVFIEGYGQFGSLSPTVDKQAWAAQAGVRATLPGGTWAEAAVVYRSGDRHAGDDHDGAFQSAERVERFLIVESAEFGLDWDTNMRALQLGVGHAFSPILAGRIDAGWFWFNGDLRTSAGAVKVDNEDDRIGLEVDGSLAYELNGQVRLLARGAILAGSDVLDALSSDGSESSWLATFGFETRF